MAYAALVSLEQTIDQILNPDRYSTSPLEKQVIISLDKYVISLQAFLEYFPEKANNLEGRMRDVATAAEDIIECFMLEQIRSCYGYTKQLRFKFEHELNKVAKKMDSIVAEVVEIKNSIIIKDEQLSDSSIASSSSGVAPAGTVEMVGFDDDLMELKDRLTGQSAKLQFLSIVGMGGIGKTTLAKNVYDDQLTKEHFQIRGWVTVSQDYRAGEILSSLLDSMKEFDPKGSQQRNVHKAKRAEQGNKSWAEGKRAEKSNISRAGPKPAGKAKRAEQGNKPQAGGGPKPAGDESKAELSKQDDESKPEISESIEAMAERVYKILKGRRYVIVMDDMWSSKVLDDVHKLFPDDGNGSRILLTTRLSDVAAYADSSIPPYEMQLMDEDQSWNLFRHKVFAQQNRAPPELEIIGREIARSCRGLPLAVVVIAGVLSTTSKTPALWEKIAKNVNSAASKDERFEKILSLSYSNLPHRLRPCFLYMGVFPEDYRIRVSELIKLWIAEGFLKHASGSKSSEEVAEEYLEDLVRRNLILKTESKTNGRIKSCSLHDMVRNTCLRLLEEENNLRLVTNRALNNRKDPLCLSMRSIMCFDDIEGPFDHFKLLRVLHVPKFKYRLELPPQKIMNLFHLRYLAFTCYWIPSAISNFQNLQTLVIVSRTDLPSSIWKMPQLRHLIFSGRLPNPEEATTALENLQTLKEVHDLKYHAFLLQRIPNLRKLGIYYSRNCFSGWRHLNESLVYLHQLEKLKIRFAVCSRRFSVAVIPGSLKKCALDGCKLSRRFLKAIGLLPNLEVLKLRRCSLHPGFWVIGGGEFPGLKSLLIDKVEFNTLVTEDSSALPRLKCLRLYRCNDLEEISDDIGEIPTLELIEIKDGGLAVYDWARRTEEEQESLGNDALQVRCIG